MTITIMKVMSLMKIVATFSESKNSAENLNSNNLIAFVYLQAALSFNGAATGPLLGIFLLGALFPWANWLVSINGPGGDILFPLL